MPLTITHTWPQIGIETQRAKLNLSNNMVVDLKISHTNPQLQMTSTRPKLHIDQTKAFGDEGLKTITDLRNQFTQEGKQAVLDFVAKKADEGEQLSRIEDGRNAIADIARANTFPQKVFNIATIPQNPPEIQVEPGEVKIDLKRGEINLEYNRVPIDMEYIPSQIKCYMIQNGDLNIEYTGNNVDTKV